MIFEKPNALCISLCLFEEQPNAGPGKIATQTLIHFVVSKWFLAQRSTLQWLFLF